MRSPQRSQARRSESIRLRDAEREIAAIRGRRAGRAERAGLAREPRPGSASFPYASFPYASFPYAASVGRHAASIGSAALLAVVVACSAGLGYLAGSASERRSAGVLPVADASTAAHLDAPALAHHVGDRAPPHESGAEGTLLRIGRLQAELLRQRVLFRQLADVAELHGGEFELVPIPGVNAAGPEVEPRTAPDTAANLGAHLGVGTGTAASEPIDPRHDIDLLIAQLDPMLEQSARLRRIFVERRHEFDWKVSGRPMLDGQVSSGFGLRVDPLTGKPTAHRGLDFVGATGASIHALADGIVTYSGPNGGYGNLVELEHVDGYRTRYAHNDSQRVALGERVSKGQQIATLGSSGRSTGPHLHLEVRHHGKALDPRFFVR